MSSVRRSGFSASVIGRIYAVVVEKFAYSVLAVDAIHVHWTHLGASTS
jgi:hypothetical protein